MIEFSNDDILQIEQHGLTPDAVAAQLDAFARGFAFSDIVAPATAGDGVIQLDAEMRRHYIDIYEQYQRTHSVVKFVPASGAATRMFRDLFEFLNTGARNTVTDAVLNNLSRFAFYDDLKKFLPDTPTDTDIIERIVTDAGLKYGHMPKALIKFHRYADGARTALAEHLDEGAEYARGADGVNIHFTVSPEHRAGFEELLHRLVPEYSARYGVQYNIELSYQKSSTDTIAVNPDNTPFRDADGRLLFRPAGHGALIENLNEIDADLIFIKNIDNVCAASHRGDTIEYKSALAGYLVMLQSKIFDYLNNTTAPLGDVIQFINDNLGVRLSRDATRADCNRILSRPLRVCGVVRNTGAPGGGPFWVRAADGTISLQIVESAQIAPDARDIMNTSQYFNPVDLVCATRDASGRHIDLIQFVDENTGFISEKSAGGRPLRAMERPGLWNGAMAGWNTVFIEVPPTTFTPVKVVADLLSAPHINV